LDHHGQLFLHETRAATALKDKNFLDFFFRRMNINPQYSAAATTSSGSQGFPFLSKCGIEHNFMDTADATLQRPPTPFVFVDLDRDSASQYFLRYAGSLQVPFDPTQLYRSADGSLYHPMLMSTDSVRRPQLAYGVLSSRLALRLSESLIANDADHDPCLEWQGKNHRIPELHTVAKL
jgi:hypothetical protein